MIVNGVEVRKTEKGWEYFSEGTCCEPDRWYPVNSTLGPFSGEAMDTVLNQLAEAEKDKARLDWVLQKGPRFEEGYLILWMGPCAAEAAGFGYQGGSYIAEGKTARGQIDNAMAGQLRHIG